MRTRKPQLFAEGGVLYFARVPGSQQSSCEPDGRTGRTAGSREDTMATTKQRKVHRIPTQEDAAVGS